MKRKERVEKPTFRALFRRNFKLTHSTPVAVMLPGAAGPCMIRGVSARDGARPGSVARDHDSRDLDEERQGIDAD